MLWYHYVFGAVLVVASVVITIVVLLQEGRQSSLSGVITGGPENSYGSKAKGRTVDGKLERLTKSFIVVFFVLVLAAFLIFLFV